jgi:hypothetical protein
MPAKRKRTISRGFPVSPEAVKRWQEIRPAGIERRGPGAMLIDDELADALGLPTLVWLGEAAEALDRLEKL